MLISFHLITMRRKIAKPTFWGKQRTFLSKPDSPARIFWNLRPHRKRNAELRRFKPQEQTVLRNYTQVFERAIPNAFERFAAA